MGCRLFLAAATMNDAVAARPFTPQIPNAVTLDFAWRQMEGFVDHQLGCIDIDQNGHVWLGIGSEVVHYDGRRTQTFGISEALGSELVLDLLVTQSGSIYVFQRDGISLWNGENWSPIYEGSVNNAAMELAIEANDGTVWAAGSLGLFQIDDRRVQLHRTGRHLATVMEDQQGYLWAVTLDDGSTYRFAKNGSAITAPEKWNELLPRTANGTSRYGLVQLPDGKVWRFSTDPDDPARFYDLNRGEWSTVDFNLFGGSNQIQGQLRTSDGVLWVVSDGVLHGLVEGEWKLRRPLNSRHGPMRANFAQAPNGDLWLLNYQVSLFRIDYTGRQWGAYSDLLFQHEETDGSRWFISKAGTIVRQNHDRDSTWVEFSEQDGVLADPIAVFSHSDGSIWVIGSDRGAAALSIFSKQGKWKTRSFPHLGEAFHKDAWVEFSGGDVLLSISRLEHWSVAERSEIVRFTPDGVMREQFSETAPVLPHRIIGLAQYDEGGIWINEGFTIWQWEIGRGNEVDERNRPGFWIDDFELGPAEDYWLANWGSGVVHQTIEGEVRTFTERDGLSSRFVAQLLPGFGPDSWFALTSQGLDRFDGRRWHPVGGPRELINHREASVLTAGREGDLWVAQGTRPWFQRVFARSADRTLSGDAFNSLRYRVEKEPPDTFLAVDYLPDTEDRGLSVRWWGKDAWSQTPLEELRFSYRLDGSSWTEFSSERQHSFHQLDDGPHVLEVRARDQAFNVDPSPVRLEFAIPPPMWRQPWFIALAVLVTLLIVGLIAIILRQRWRHLVAFEAQRISFFTNISHELRTPLALIMAPLEKATTVLAGDPRADDLQISLRSCRRLNELVDQLLDFRKIESNAMELELSEGDIATQVTELISAFQSLAETKLQELRFSCPRETWRASYDLDKLQKIVANLVMNALKFTSRGGRIEVSMQEASERDSTDITWIRICVEDNGPGIPPERQLHLFEPFYRAGKNEPLDPGGTGLGLSLSKELARIMGGTIEVLSPTNSPDPKHSGSRFTVTLPLRPAADLVKRDTSGRESKELDLDTTPQTVNGETGELKVLLIDDNDELRDFVGRELRSQFQVSLAEDGQEGLRLARETVPDVVVADVMMPRMDGFEFCRALKADSATSHIPVIMLTARSSSEFEQKGLEAGADEYLTKPLSISKLELRIKNLLETRRSLQERLRVKVMSEPVMPELADPEEVFLQRVVEMIEVQLREGACGVDELATALSLSRSSFYRKLKAITGESPNDFIRRYRMQRAAQLLAQTDLAVTDVMLEVGYGELGHFGKLFKNFHGHSPSEHRTRIRL